MLRAGRIEQQGTPIELYDNPNNMFVAGFIGSPRMNFVAGEVIEVSESTTVRLGDFGSPTINVRTRSNRAKPGDHVSVGIRPEHFVDAVSAKVTLTARAQVVEQLGGVSYVYGAGVNGGQVTVQQKGHSPMAAESEVQFGVDPAVCLLFDTSGERI